MLCWWCRFNLSLVTFAGSLSHLQFGDKIANKIKGWNQFIFPPKQVSCSFCLNLSFFGLGPLSKGLGTNLKLSTNKISWIHWSLDLGPSSEVALSLGLTSLSCQQAGVWSTLKMIIARLKKPVVGSSATCVKKTPTEDQYARNQSKGGLNFVHSKAHL